MRYGIIIHGETTLQEYAQALVVWDEFSHSLPVWARPFRSDGLSHMDLLMWAQDLESVLGCDDVG